MAQTHVVVDGSNIATEGRSTPSLQQLDEAVRAFLDQFPHDVYTVVVDATFEHRIDESERALYRDAVDNNELITPPAGTIGRGDRFLLEIADRAGATVFSNDSFQEFHGDYGWLFDTGRLIGGKPVPAVGWIFTERTPVRGPKSRQATRTAKRKAARAPSKPAKAGSRGPRKSAPPAAPPKVAKAATAKSAPASSPRRRRRRSGSDAVNEPLPFIEFVAENQPGSTIKGEVAEFSSHGAYVTVGDVRCYVTLKHLGDPAPRRARDVLTRGEVREFVVQAIDAPRRGIDLALPGFEDKDQIELARTDEPEAAKGRRSRKRSDGSARGAGRRSSRSTKAAREAEPSGSASHADKAPVEAGAKRPEGEDTLAQKKKAPARKAPAKKKKAPARKAPAKKKAPAKRSPAKKKAPAKRKKAPARKAPAKKKSAAKKSAAKKKAPAKKKAAAKRKAPAKRKKATARKSTAKKKA